ncbi:MAG: V-type ATP synthase subunit K [Euryarchaeota archaeon]|nr:V-type ATP synthase subunit K [Euryarchaeota archaeon]MBU4033147.1 V-type ATP synthase subunit K [Candidatus Thermoplasmatota archaeon]MBU4072072.1 V-type ATP synthase subunit K [Candidatus Thermoplasmatota archaeon]MBU4143382.1 V-type ATP synthase subunit K [Candidatus Thermoplasmatota archaeon]
MVIEGLAIAISGAALAAGLSCAGSSIGVGLTGQASAGVVSEDPEKFGKLLILQVLPGTQGIYGFLAAFWVMMKLGLLSGTVATISPSTGLALALACIPMMIGCPLSAVWQGKVAASGVGLVAKKPEEMGKAIIMAALVETYAVLSLLITIFLVNTIPLT